MADITFKIEESYGSISSGDWTVELNLVSWNGKNPKMEIRKWDSNHERMGKGVTLTREEVIDFLMKAPEMLRNLGVNVPETDRCMKGELPF